LVSHRSTCSDVDDAALVGTELGGIVGVVAAVRNSAAVRMKPVEWQICARSLSQDRPRAVSLGAVAETAFG